MSGEIGLTELGLCTVKTDKTRQSIFFTVKQIHKKYQSFSLLELWVDQLTAHIGKS